MIIDLIIYAIVTMVAIRYAAAWFTSGQTAFVAREKNALVMRILAVGLITVVYMVLAIGMNMTSPLLGALILTVVPKGMAAGIVHALAFAVLDVLALAVTIKGAAMVMKNTVKAENFGAAVLAALLIIGLATIAQTAVAVAIVSMIAP
ncbi:MAG: hypothetical protein IT342_12810 [Candidatus Melainabacteria bacterium]|nr:hypothetical protein [Candidatus Melainabacteria bacterium]